MKNLLDEHPRHGPLGDQLRCPTCDHEYTHLRSTKAGPGAHDGRLVAWLVFEGECGHWFEVTFDQHKGETFVRAEACQPGGHR